MHGIPEDAARVDTVDCGSSTPDDDTAADVAIFVEIYGAGLKFVFQYKWSFLKNRNFVEVGTFGPQKIATSLKLEKTAIYAH